MRTYPGIRMCSKMLAFSYLREGYNRINHHVRAFFNHCQHKATDLLFNETTRDATSRFAAGFRTVINFPFTVVKMPFRANSRELMGHVIQYNALYYLTPVIIYHAYLRDVLISMLDDSSGNASLIVDMVANAVFLRALTNAYAANVFNNVNATSSQVNPLAQQDLIQCDCPDSRHIRRALISPAYYLGKVLTPTILGQIPKFGFIFNVTLKPLAWGECLAESQMPDLCHDHAIEFLAQHNLTNYGLGIGVLASTKIASKIVSHFTGVSGFFVEDAVFNLLFPLITYHVYVTRHHKQRLIIDKIRERGVDNTDPIDIFYPVRDMIDNGIKRFSGQLIERLMTADQKGNLLPYLQSLTQSKTTLFLERLFFYQHLRTDPKRLIKYPPLNLLIRLNKDATKSKLQLLQSVAHHPDLVLSLLDVYHTLPMLPPKAHLRQIVALIKQYPQETIEYTTYLQQLIVLACEIPLPEPFIRRHVHGPINMMDSYYGPSPQAQIPQRDKDSSLDQEHYKRQTQGPIHVIDSYYGPRPQMPQREEGIGLKVESCVERETLESSTALAATQVSPQAKARALSIAKKETTDETDEYHGFFLVRRSSLTIDSFVDIADDENDDARPASLPKKARPHLD